MIGIAPCHGIFEYNCEWGTPIKGRGKRKNSNPSNAEAKIGSHINISINLKTMKRIGFSPYGPSKATLE